MPSESAAEQLAGSLVEVVAGGKLLATDEPLKLVLPEVERAEHQVVLQATVILYQRFSSTAVASPDLEKLERAVSELALPTLLKFGQRLTARRAFQAACALTPLLNRAAVLAAQCCALAIKGPWKADVVLPFCEAVTDLNEVFSHAVIARAEMLRPFDASRIFASHKHFDECQAAAAKAVAASGMLLDVSSSDLARLAPLPSKPVHRWRYEQLRHFWETSCSQYSEKISIDVLAILLLQAAGAEVSLGNREAVMRRLHGCACRHPGEVFTDELDACTPEIRRSGGLKAWILALVRGGADPTISFAASLGKVGSSTLTPRSVKTWHQPFLLSASYKSSGREGGLSGAVAQGLLKDSQRLVLGDQVPTDDRDRHGDTPLHLAASLDRKHAPLGSLLLSKGADSNAQDRHLATPLHKAAGGHKNLVQELVNHGAEVGRQDRWSSTPLHRAAEHGKADIAQLLLDKGATCMADGWGATPLHRAAARGQLAVVETLLASRAETNVEDRRGERPLHLASSRGDYAVVKLLLEHHGEASARSRIGKTPEDCARDHGHMDVVTLLQHQSEWIPSVV